MSESDTAGRIRLLKPDTRNLNTAGHGNYPFNPSGVMSKPGPLDPDLYLLHYLSNGRNHVNTLVLAFGIFHNLLKM